MQRLEPVASTRLLAARFRESWSRSAVVRVDLQTTRKRDMRFESCSRKVVVRNWFACKRLAR